MAEQKGKNIPPSAEAVKIRDDNLERRALAVLLNVAQTNGPVVATVLEPEHFLTYFHVATAMVECSRTLGNFDPVLLRNELRNHGFEEKGSFDVVVDMMHDEMAAVPYAKPYLDEIAKLADLRALYDKAGAIARDCRAGKYQSAMEGMARIGSGIASPIVPVRDIAEVVEQVNKRPVLSGVTTGWERLDSSLRHGGYPCSELTVVLGKTGTGKTAWMGGGVTAACTEGKTVLVATYEMPAEMLARRLVQYRIGVGTVGEADYLGWREDWDAALKDLATFWNLKFFDPTEADNGDYTVESLMDRAIAESKAGPLHEVWVDYVGLMKSKDRCFSRFEELTVVSRKLKAIAKRTGAAVIALSQTTDEQGEWHTRGCREFENDAAVTIECRREEENITLRKNRYGQGRVVIPCRFLDTYAKYEPTG